MKKRKVHHRIKHHKKKPRRGRPPRKVLKQRGKSIRSIDERRKAKPPGWRKSKNGKWYHETRKNRCDKKGGWV